MITKRIYSAIIGIIFLFVLPIYGNDYIEMNHIAGWENGTFGYRSYELDSILIDHIYEMTISQYFWDDSLNENRDVSQSTISGIGYTVDGDENINLRFTLDLVSPDYDWVEGIKLTFPPEINILSATGPDAVTAYIDMQFNTVLFGNEVNNEDDLTGLGVFSGAEVITVSILPTTLPIDVDYVIFDDGWAYLYCNEDTNGDGIPDNQESCEEWGITDADIINATGICIINEIFEFDHEDGQYLFTLTDITTSELLLYNYPVPIDNDALNIPITDGFKIVKGTVSYDDLPNYISITIVGGGTYDIGSYYDYGWAETAMSMDAYGQGTSDWGVLSRDVKVVWDGVYGDPDANGFVSVVSGGSKAWIYGARDGDLATHPSPENPGTSDPFLITVPFKVYDMEAGDEPVQISIIIYDRIQAAGTGYDGSYDGDGDGTPAYYAFNPFNRMYTEFVNRPYDETLADFASNEAYLTWNTVWWGSSYEAGDWIQFEYGAPLSSEDRYQFTPGDCMYIDDCGICNGDNSTCTGCTDSYAINYDPDATIDDGSCEYVYDTILSFGVLDLSSHTLEINLENTMPVSGFQFEVDLGESMAITEVSGGSTEEMGFMVDFSENNNVVLGFSIDGNEIDVGIETLANLTFSGYGQATVCLSNAIIISGFEDAEYFDVEYGYCITINYMKGDVNLDEALDILDLVMVMNIIFENIAPDENEIWAADYNSDGDINIMDIVQIVNCILSGCWEGEPLCDIDGNCYETIQIGEQLWMAENLKVTHYNNGDEISYPSDEDFGSDDEGQYGVYDNDPSNADIYGNLYNFAAVDDDRGVCPDGFHVPSDEEFMELEMELGMSEEDANSTGYRGTDEGSKLAGNSDLWWDGNLVNNLEFGTSGFTALPAGYRNYGNGFYYSMGNYGYFWSSSETSSTSAWSRELYYDYSNVYRYYDYKQFGFSVRCLGD